MFCSIGSVRCGGWLWRALNQSPLSQCSVITKLEIEGDLLLFFFKSRPYRESAHISRLLSQISRRDSKFG